MESIEQLQEFAPTIHGALPNGAVSERGRRANEGLLPNLGLPDAHPSAEASGPTRDRQTEFGPSPIRNASVGHLSDVAATAVDVGDDEGAHRDDVTPWVISPLVVEIEALWRMRQRWHRAEKSLVLQAKAICRSWTDGDKAAASKLYDAVRDGSSSDVTIGVALMPFLSSVERFEKERGAIEKRLRHLAKTSALWPWVSEVKGFGPLNLAAIIGEAGEIGSYRNPSCLWKRLGLAVIDGGRQRRVTDVVAAERHGYNPRRRTVAYLLGDTLIKAGEGCRYRPVYAERKVLEAGRVATAAHAHNRAARYMVKRVIRDLWLYAVRGRDSPGVNLPPREHA